jgi:hypothetical protein
VAKGFKAKGIDSPSLCVAKMDLTDSLMGAKNSPQTLMVRFIIPVLCRFWGPQKGAEQARFKSDQVIRGRERVWAGEPWNAGWS